MHLRIENCGRGYCRPCLGPDVQGCNMVSHTSMAARNTGEGRLIGSVPLIDAAARRTSPGGVARIDEQDRHARQSRLVGDEGSELTETPIVQPSALAGPGLNPAAYPLQVFKAEGATGAFGLQHECFADAVNTPPPEGGRLLKQAMRQPAGLTLQGPLLPPLSRETLDA